MAADTERMRLEIRDKRMLTDDICLFELVDPGGGELPAFTAGAHVTVETPSGAMRRYSLSNHPDERHRYVIGVKRESDGRGGSASMVEGTAVGDAILVEPPENDFPLKSAPSYLLIAGGIGITPVLSMARVLAARDADFKLIFCTRSPAQTAFAAELAEPPFAGRVTIHHDEGNLDNAYDFWEHFEEPGKGHVYCCGPAALMEEVRGMTGHWPEGAVNFEDFKPVEVIRADDAPFRVHLARSGRTVEVPADRTILETLRAAGLDARSSCERGTCGTCRTGLIDGDVDHRDMVLTDEERRSNIMVCVSRARSGDLTLDA